MNDCAEIKKSECIFWAVLYKYMFFKFSFAGDVIDYSTSGSPANMDGLLVTLKDHDTYLSAFRPVFEDQQKQEQNRGKREVEAPAGAQAVEGEKKPVENYKIAERETR